MALSTSAFSQTIKKKGYFNFNGFYTFCFDWFGNEGFDLYEDEYTEKLSDFGKEIIIKWKAEKKITDYFKFQLKIDWHILGMNSAEIERDGKKEKTNKGDLKLKIKSEFVRDYENRWEKKPMNKFMRGIYEKYIIRTTVDEYENRLAGKSSQFVSEVKAFLELN